MARVTEEQAAHLVTRVQSAVDDLYDATIDQASIFVEQAIVDLLAAANDTCEAYGLNIDNLYLEALTRDVDED